MVRRLRLACTLLALCLAGAAAVAEESGGDSRDLIHFETNAGFDLSFFAFSLHAEPHIVFRPTRFGIGLGAKLFVGGSHFDFLVAPFGRLELGWFYLNGGYVFEIVDAIDRYQMVEDGVLASLGIAPGLLPVGEGRLGLDVGLETNLKLGSLEQQLVAAYPLIAGWGSSGLPGFLLLHAVATTSLRIGVLYTFPL